MSGGDFKKFWDLGYHRLVPVIPPAAQVNEKSRIATRIRAGDDARGKVPGVKQDNGDWRGMQFVAMESQESDLPKWQEWEASVGVKLGQGLIALDIDTTNKAAAQKLFTLAAETLGPAHVRFGRKPKCLLLYEAPEDTAYQQLRFSTETEDKAIVELLAEGRQFVADGLHPATGEPYSWPQGIPRRDQLTRISAEQIDAFYSEAERVLPGAERAANASGVADVDQNSLKAPSWETLKATVDAMPNTSELFPEREDYVKVAYAIKAAAPGGYEYEARDLYLEWCDRWDDPEGKGNDQDIAMADWNRAKPPFKTGYRFLVQFAPGLFFQPATEDDTRAQEITDMFSQESEHSEGLRLLDLNDVFDLPDPKFLIDRHIPETGFGLLYGDPGAGKSFLALDMSLAIAFGRHDWHGDEIAARNGGRVLYIAGEGSSGFKARARAWIAENLEPDEAKQKPNIKFLFQSINFMKPEDVKRLLAAVEAAGYDDAAMIVVDTVSRSIPGADENLQKDMTVFVAACDALRMQTGAFVLGVHHTSKAGEMRGSSVFAGQADVVLQLTRKKGATIGKLTCAKQKDAPDGWHDHYRLAQVSLPDGTSSLVPERVGAGEVAEQESVTPDQQKLILDAMQEAWDKGEPWSDKQQSKDRFIGRVVARDYDVPAHLIMACLDIWTQQGLVEVQMFDKRNGKKGLRVVGHVVRDDGIEPVDPDENIFE